MQERGENVANDTGIKENTEISCEAVVRLNSDKSGIYFFI